MTTDALTQYEKVELLLPELIEARKDGVSISALALEHGLRREAVATVLAQHGHGISSPAREAVLAYVREHQGLSVDDLSLRLDISKSSISRYLRGTDEHKLVVSRKQTDLSKFSDAEMAASLRNAFAKLDDRSKGLSRIKYNALIKGSDAPAASTYIRRYGSWSAACEKAGVPAAKARRENYVQEHSNDDIIAAVNEFVRETGETTYNEYARWARKNSKPSGPLLVQRWGGWAKARREALSRAGAAA